ncbi:MAG TPA: hypothetical protein VMF12_10995 [Xanthobacteraceae bacterium]|nr:hypothetical protein [Xanthobacteraceae bacterium]
MSAAEKWVTTAEALVAAIEEGVGKVVVSGCLSNVPSLQLLPGQSLCGAAENSKIAFVDGVDGVELTSGNGVHNVHLCASPERRAIFNDTTVSSLGRIVLRNVTTHGRVQILARDKVRSGHLEVNGLDIIAADARAESERPHGYGVYVLHGAFTLWNMQRDEDAAISADLVGISAGRDGDPVRGSGIFIGGAGDAGGRLIARRLETGPVYSDGGIAPGTPDCIAGGVFVVYGAYADRVRNRGPVTTYGANDMVLDNWGVVDRWTADEKITSHGPSGIGFVNFGTVNVLQVNAPIETFGQGARGFNVYSGTVHSAEFERIVTHADGAVGIQISQPVGVIKVQRGIETYGGTGNSLVKGVVVKLAAIALSLKPGAAARNIDIAGGLITHGEGVAPLELNGVIESFQVTDGFAAAVSGSQSI